MSMILNFGPWPLFGINFSGWKAKTDRGVTVVSYPLRHLRLPSPNKKPKYTLRNEIRTSYSFLHSINTLNAGNFNSPETNETKYMHIRKWRIGNDHNMWTTICFI